MRLFFDEAALHEALLYQVVRGGEVIFLSAIAFSTKRQILRQLDEGFIVFD